MPRRREADYERQKWIINGRKQIMNDRKQIMNGIGWI